MSKPISFAKKDAKLIHDIEEYQKQHEIRYFVDAVRQLCQKGLVSRYNLEINVK